MPIATIEDGRLSAVSQVVKRLKMCTCKIFHVDIVPDTGTVFGVVIGSKNRHSIAFSAGCLTGDFDKVGRLWGGLTQCAVKRCPRHVEIPQGNESQTRICSPPFSEVLKRPFGNELGAPVRIDGMG